MPENRYRPECDSETRKDAAAAPVMHRGGGASGGPSRFARLAIFNGLFYLTLKLFDAQTSGPPIMANPAGALFVLVALAAMNFLYLLIDRACRDLMKRLRPAAILLFPVASFIAIFAVLAAIAALLVIQSH